jgi:hypothetical protein
MIFHFGHVVGSDDGVSLIEAYNEKLYKYIHYGFGKIEIPPCGHSNHNKFDFLLLHALLYFTHRQLPTAKISEKQIALA